MVKKNDNAIDEDNVKVMAYNNAVESQSGSDQRYDVLNLI